MTKKLALTVKVLVAIAGTLFLLKGTYYAFASAIKYEPILTWSVAYELAAIMCYVYNLKEQAWYWQTICTGGIAIAGSVAIHSALKLFYLIFLG